MTQQVLDMMARMGGADGIAAMAARVGLTPAQAESAMAALVPAITGGMAKQAQAGNGSLVDQLAGMAASFTGSAASDEAVTQGGEILGHVLPGDTAHAVTQAAASKTGLDLGQLSALLPMAATMAASALGNSSVAAAPAAGGGLGGMLGSLLGGLGGGGSAPGGTAAALMAMIDSNKDGNPLDEIMGMLKR